MTNEHGLEPMPKISGAYLGVRARDFEIVAVDGYYCSFFELRLMRTGGGYEEIYGGSYDQCLAAQAGFLAAVRMIRGE